MGTSEDKWEFRRDDGETMHDVCGRVEKFLGELTSLDSKPVLVVTHAINIRMMRLLTDMNPADLWDYEVVQGGYDIVELDNLG